MTNGGSQAWLNSFLSSACTVRQAKLLIYIFFFPKNYTYFRLGMLVLEWKLSSKYVVIVLIRGIIDVSVFDAVSLYELITWILPSFDIVMSLVVYHFLMKSLCIGLFCSCKMLFVYGKAYKVNSFTTNVLGME